jgi:cytochrome c553
MLTKTCLIIELVLICALSASAVAEVRFNRDVRPILSDNCFACHGPDEKQRKARLRLDIREEALKPAESGDAAVVPGEPEQSELTRRIESADSDEVMPPPKSHKQLTALQKELLKRWIAEGAKYEAHWAFTPLVRPALPTVKDKAWPRNAIDYFILDRLEQAQLAPAPPASPEALLRRASFGVTGLPPLPEAVAEFAATHSDADYKAVLERLLASTQYGEHWARHWMDLTRYADSAGYELDYLFTHAWRYRDWLVRSFTANKPMDRFIQEQIAGDELWSGVEDAEDGSLFLTIGPMRHEGGIQRTKDRENEWLTDVADTTGSAFLGLTMGCARCHDHKFDPLTQSDYYGLQAIFADSELKQDRAGKEAKETSPAFIRAVLREQAGAVQVLRRGEVDLPLREAVAALPAVLPGGGPLPAEKHRRAALARWLTEANNPLTARVLVNRVWQWHFGHGLVRTANDFGRQGEAPSHPELLDWLASELIASGSDLRHLQRLVLESATYRQSSLRSAEARSIDPENRWLSGFPRRRLQAEELRDALLSVSGALNAKSFGPPVVPPMEPWALAALRNKNWEPPRTRASGSDAAFTM